jgi:hypothetical protein
MTSPYRSELVAAGRLAVLEARMTDDARARLREQVVRRTTRLMSLLGAVATIVATYDLSLLARAAGR